MIFTSTPQGLEPGRTGFCTVGRHRNLRSRLVRELERISVYEFNLGEGATKAEINSFRRFELGTEEFFALSRIRDAGLDYTNRTNYIAHHLIFDGLEVAVNPSPAEIFLQWDGWLDVWEGSPRWFEDEEIIDVSACKMTALSPAQSWQTLSGDGGNAAYLVAEKAKRPILLETHPGQEDELLQLFAESSALVSMPMEAWHFPFTTYLQETDDSKDFSWIGGCGQPSVERLKQNGPANHLNFTAFDQNSVRDPMDEKQVFIARNGRKAAIKKKAPPPPVEEVAGAGSFSEGGEASTRISDGRAGGGGGFSRTEKEQFRQAAASHAAAQATATAQTGEDGGKKRKKPAKWPWISALAAVMLLAVFVILKTDVLDIFGNEVGGGNGHSSSGGGSQSTDPSLPPEKPDDSLQPPKEIVEGIPFLAKVTDKDKRLGTWIEFSVGEAPPARVNIAEMSDQDYATFGDKLGALDVGDEMTVTFRNGPAPGSFAIAALKPPVSPVVEPVVPITNGSAPPDAGNPDPEISSTGQEPAESEFLASDVIINKDLGTVTFPSSSGVLMAPYRFPPNQRDRFEELQYHLNAGRKVKFKYRLVRGQIDDFDFSVQIPETQPVASPAVSLTAPPPFPVAASYVMWLTKGEVQDPQLESVSAQGDAAFVQSLKTTLSRVAASNDSFVWETDYLGAEALVDTPLMEGSQRYVVRYDARVKELLGIERYTLETPQVEGSTLFLRFQFNSAQEVSLILENQGARNAVSRGILLRFPDPKTGRAIDLFILSSRVVSNKPNQLPKTYLEMLGNRVSLAKNGAFAHGLKVMGSTGSRAMQLSVNPSNRVYYGNNLSPNDFTNRRLETFPALLVKPVAGNPLSCELALFIDYMTDLRKEFQDQIGVLQQKAGGDQAAQMPNPKIFDALEKFGGRAGYNQGNFKPGTGVGAFGPHLINVITGFFRKTHNYAPVAIDKLKEDLVLDPRNFYLNDLEYREFWRKVCERAKKEAFAPFGIGYDPKNLSTDINRVIGTLRFLREAERAFGVKDQGIGKMIFDTVREIIEPTTGAVKKLHEQLTIHKATPEGRAAIPIYTQKWNAYLEDFAEVHAPAELTSAELRKGIACIENPDLLKAYREHLFDSGTSKQRLAPLKQWYALLESEIMKKDPRKVPEQYEPARKAQVMQTYFNAEEWSLRLFRQGQVEPEAELIRFK